MRKIVPSNQNCKKYFCSLCKKLVCNYGRHLLTRHKERPEKIAIINIPKGIFQNIFNIFILFIPGHPLRHRRISELRKKDQFFYNTNPAYSKETMVVKRRPSKTKNRTFKDYRMCSNCGEIFSVLSLRVHFSKCKKNHH